MNNNLPEQLKDIPSRVAVLEMKVDSIAVNLSEITDSVRAINKTTAAVQSELTRYKGFVGGVQWFGSALIAGLVIFKDQVISWLK